MNYSIIIYISVLCIGINGDYYTEKDFSVIESLAKYFHSSNLVFVKNGADVSLMKRCQEFLRTDYYYAVFNSFVLKEILENDALQVRFFNQRSIIITKEQLNLTELLDKVLFPHYVTWIILDNDGIRETYIPASCNVIFINSTIGPVIVEQVYHPKPGYEAVKTSLKMEVPNSIFLEKEKTFSLPSRKINFRNLSLNLQILHKIRNRILGVLDLDRKQCLVIGVAVPCDTNIILKEAEKQLNYRNINKRDVECQNTASHNVEELGLIPQNLQLHLEINIECPKNWEVQEIVRDRKECQKEEGEIMKRLGCIHQVLLMMVGLRLNYSVNFVECTEKEYPYTFPNGTDSELYIKIKNREVDFSSAITHVAARNFRRTYVDYVWPTFVLKTMMYLRQARTHGRWGSYLKPLEPSVWWGILTCIAVTGVLVKIFENLLANTLKFDLSLAYELSMSIFRSLQVFCNQAIADPSTSYSIRMIFILKFFVVSIFFQAYCGYLVSSLAVVITRFPFTDLNGFLENQEYKVMTLRKGFHRYYFRKVILDGYDEKFMLPDDDLPLTVQEAVDRLCAEDYLALGGFREDLLNFDSLRCKISELPSPLVHSYFGIGVPKKAPLKEYLKRELLHLRSTGIIPKMATRLSTHSNFHDSSTAEEYPRVSIVHVFSIFILLYAGLGLSLIIFCFEIMFRKRIKKSSFDGKGKLKFENF